MRVVTDKVDGIVRGAHLVDGQGARVPTVDRFLTHLMHAEYSPNTVVAYAYDLRLLFDFLEIVDLAHAQLSTYDTVRYPAYLRQLPSRRREVDVDPRAGATKFALAPASAKRALATASSFYTWLDAIGEINKNPFLLAPDSAAQRTSNRHQPYLGTASRQRPMRRTVTVRTPSRLPRPLNDADLRQFFAGLRTLRDSAFFLLLLDGGLRPGEALGLHLQDIQYGKKRVTIAKRDDHPRGARQKSRRERVVDLLAPRTLDTLSRYVMHERPLESSSPFAFLVGGKVPTREDPLSYDAINRVFARTLQRLGIQAAGKTPHALRHTHATQLWEAGMPELALQKRLGHASVESTRLYTRTSDDKVRQAYEAALLTIGREQPPFSARVLDT